MPRVTCPECGRENDFLPFLAGMRVKCAACPGMVQVPAAEPDGPQECPACGFRVKHGRMNDCPQCGHRIGAVSPSPRSAPPPAATSNAAIPHRPTEADAADSAADGDVDPVAPPPAADTLDRHFGPPQPEFASVSMRRGARLLDRGIVVLLVGIGFFAYVMLRGGGVIGPTDDSVWFPIMCVGLGPVLFWVFNAVLFATRGQTVGKWAFKLKVVRDEDGGPVGFVSGFLLREFLHLGELVLLLIAATILTPLIFLPLWFYVLSRPRERNQFPHDTMTGTMVVQVPK